MTPLNVAIVGATGLVGSRFRSILEERGFPVGSLSLLASERSAGRVVEFAGCPYRVGDVAEFDFSGTHLALFSAGSAVAREHGPRATELGAVVIDNSSCFRYASDVPLVVPEVNGDQVSKGKQRGIIANPNCSTIQLVVVLKPLRDAVGIRRVSVCTYQAVSGAGVRAVRELDDQLEAIRQNRPAKSTTLPARIAFNAVPHIDGFEDNRYTREEMKLVWETRKILEDEAIDVNPTCVRVPVYVGHSEAVHVETVDPVTPDHAKELLQAAPGVSVMDRCEAGGYPTPAVDVEGTDSVFVGRIRQDLRSRRGLNLWVVADNERKGAALNAIQIAERLLPLLGM